VRVGSLFSGIGGFDLGLERVGYNVVWQVENDAYCRKVLRKHWPDVPCYRDVHDVGAHNLEEVDVICGGFPCQPVSQAGKKLAQDDERWLWPEFARVLGELRPDYALVENVPGLLVRGLGDVLGDLAELGYDAEWGCVSAASVGAPHLRKRIFVVAHTDEGRCERPRASDTRQANVDTQHGHISGGCGTNVADTNDTRCREQRGSVAVPEKLSSSERRSWWSTEPDVGRVADGIPARVDRLRALGNAIVPQVAEWIGKRLLLTGGKFPPEPDRGGSGL